MPALNERSLEWWTAVATAADGLVFPGTARLELPVEPVADSPVVDRATGLTWLEVHHPVLDDAQLVAVDRGEDRLVMLLASAARHLGLRPTWLLGQRLAAEDRGVRAAQAAVDSDAEAFLLIRRAHTHRELGDPRRAVVDLSRVLELVDGEQPRPVELVRCREALGGLGLVHLDAGEAAQAVVVLTQALELAWGAGDRLAEAIVQGNLARAHRELGSLERALAHAERAVELRRGIGAPVGTAWALHDLALVHRARGELHTAVALCEQAEAAYAAAGGAEAERAQALATLADCLDDLGQVDRAADCRAVITRNRAEQARTGLERFRPPPPARPDGDPGPRSEQVALARRAALADAVVYPSPNPPLPRPKPGPDEEPLDRAGALAVLEALPDRLAVVQHAAREAADHVTVILLAVGARHYRQLGTDLLPARLEAEWLGIDAARAAGDRETEAYLTWRAGHSNLLQRRWSAAEAHFGAAVELSDGHPWYRREECTGRALALTAQSRHADALAALDEGVALAEGDFDRALYHANSSRAHAALNNWRAALEHARRELDYRRRLPEPQGVGYALHNLGIAHRGLGQRDHAVDALTRAITIYAEAGGADHAHADALVVLADIDPAQAAALRHTLD